MIAESEGGFPAGKLCLGHVTVTNLEIGSEVACPVRFNGRWVSHSSRVVGRVHEKRSVPPLAAAPEHVSSILFSSLLFFDFSTQVENVYNNPLPLSTTHRSLDTVSWW
jgi:hypothetical protein